MAIQPAPATIFLKCDYWPLIDKMRQEDETTTGFMFEFLSLHAYNGIWSICSCLSLIDQVTGACPVT